MELFTCLKALLPFPVVYLLAGAANVRQESGETA